MAAVTTRNPAVTEVGTAACAVDLSLAYARGAYTASLALGAPAQPVRVLLDTGSSAFAVVTRAYDPARDPRARPTTLVQTMRYGAGAWAGPLLRTDVTLPGAAVAPGVSVALIEAQRGSFYDADGILGLAYGGLDPAYDLGPCQRAQGHDPHTWPWPYALHGDPNDPAFHALLAGRATHPVVPLFSRLAALGVTADRFALKLRRAVRRVSAVGLSDEALAQDPENRGLWLPGGGAAHTEHYRGPLSDLRVVDDRYYNLRLCAVQVGDGARIAVPPLDAAHRAYYRSNAILDSGCSFLLLEASTFDALGEALEARYAGARQLIDEAGQALAAGRGIAAQRVDIARWPVLRLFLEGADGHEQRVDCAAEALWPDDAPAPGLRLCALARQRPGWPRQSILGLPFFAGRYVVFDRATGAGGQVRVASARGA